MERHWVIFGSCRVGKGYPDSVSATVSIPHLVDEPWLVSTAVRSDEGPRPARIPFPVALFPVPAVLQHLVFLHGHPRERLLRPMIDRRVTENAKPSPLGLVWQTTSARSTSASGRSTVAARADIEVGTLVGVEDPWNPYGKHEFYC